MRIQNMEHCHISQVAQLEKLCFSEPWSEKSLDSELSNPLSLWLVALEGERVAGYVGSQTVMGETDMMNLAVHPDFRRQGIGTMLIDHLVATLKTKESTALTLEVRQSNEAAKALYGSLGFCQVGLRPNYYRNPREAAIILRKEWEL